MSIKTTQDTATSIITGVVPPNMRDRYTVRCIKATAKESKSEAANFMIELECEIVKPLEKSFGGKIYSLNSLPIRYYLMLRVNDKDTGEYDIEKSAKALATLIGRAPGDDCLHKRLGLPQEIDDENPNTKQYENLVFDAIISSQERKPKKLNQDTGEYEVIKDAKGKPISQGWEITAQVSEIMGLSEEQVGEGNPY